MKLGIFLKLATNCNPSILEVFKAPIMYSNLDGTKLRDIFPYVWNPQQAFDAFVGYGLNQRKKMLDKKDKRKYKYAIAYLRTLSNLVDLLDKKTFSLKVRTLGREGLMAVKQGECSFGKIIDTCEQLTELARICLKKCKHEPNLEKVNSFLVDIRRRYW